jgi:hypothetical protein
VHTAASAVLSGKDWSCFRNLWKVFRDCTPMYFEGVIDSNPYNKIGIINAM